MKRPAAKPSKLLQGMLGIRKPTREEKYRAALAGDMDAVKWLHFDREQWDDHLELVLQLCRDRAPQDLCRRLIVDILIKNPKRMQAQTPGSREVLDEMFSYAAFELPRDFPDEVTLWRGASACEPEAVAAGYFWSPDRDVSMRYAIESSVMTKEPPLLVRASVLRSEIAAVIVVSDDTFVGDVTREHAGFDNPWLGNDARVEVLLLAPPASVEVDDYRIWSPNLKAMIEKQIAERAVLSKEVDRVLGDVTAKIRKRMREVGYEP